MYLTEIRDLLQGEFVYAMEERAIEIVSVCASDLMSDVLTSPVTSSLLLTGLTNPQVIRTAEMAEIRAVCFVRGKRPPPATVELAKELGIPLLKTGLSMLEACGRLYVNNVRD